ncbi:MAG: DUF1501 domain-containing protein [Bacteroidetes bacterium]|nr:DUF1501 domain-containing protein [Bacteroidota bacterium]
MEQLTRRGFLKRSMLATAGTALIPQFLKAWEGPVNTGSDNVLVIIQLSGGNDGLNTVVPYRNDIYYKLRPQLGINSEKVLKVSDDLGFNPAWGSMQRLYDEGHLTVINNVGYPNPDRSHFRSMDIWQSASGSDEHITTGWIGRYLDAQCKGCGSHSALEIDDSLGLAMRGSEMKGLALLDPGKLFQATKQPFYKRLSEVDGDEPHIAYLYKTAAETASNAQYIYEKSSVSATATTFPNTELGKKLKTIAELIRSGISTKVYYASLSGFDTHVRQGMQQERLLSQYSEAVSALVSDLKQSGNLGRTLIMTFSEFGRRVTENASGGTDHGTANNLFLMGGSLRKPGFFNGAPDLSRLNEEDLVYQIDFRQIYGTLLNRWLQADDKAILGEQFPLMDFV